MKFSHRRIAQLLLVASLLTAGMTAAQAEPSMSQVYTTAQAGKLEEAQVLVQQVLVAHPNSGKAYFVQAELYARQGQPDRARESLLTAEKLSPGLAFAKPDAVQALRAQLAPKSLAHTATRPSSAYSVSQAPAQSSNAWLLPLLLTGGVITAAYFIFRRRVPVPPAQQAVYASQNGLSGPQTFGAGQSAYPQSGYPQPAGSGLGGRIMGGVATGLAVGAGVMAAEAIGRNLMGGHNAAASSSDSFGSNHLEPLSGNPDMGGENFGISDTSWNDGGGDAGGGDWDN